MESHTRVSSDEELIPIAAPEPSAADELVEELLADLSEETEQELAAQVISDYQNGLDDRVEWEARLAEWDRQYHGITPVKTFPWPGCSNFHVPLTMLGVETLKPRLLASIMGGDPIVLIKPTHSSVEERRDRAEQFLNWQVGNEMRLAPVIEESAHLFLNPGTVIAKILWRTDRRKMKAIRRFPNDIDMDTLFRALFGPYTPESIDEIKKNVWEGSIRTANDQELLVRVRIKPDKNNLLVLLERDEIVYEGPRVELIPAEDFIVPSNGGGDVQRLPWCQQRLWLYESDLRRKVESGRFFKEAVDELINVVAGRAEGSVSQDDSLPSREVKSQAEGLPLDAATDVKAYQYEIIEDYRSYDIDNDGFDEEIVCWTSPHLNGKLLGWDYLDNVYAHGKRPFVVGRYLPIPGRFYGLSFPEIVRGIQEEINAIHNMRVDTGTIQNTPGYFYRASSTHSPTQYRMKPGQGIPIDNPQTDILWPQWNGTTAFGQQEEALLYQYFERLTGLTDLSLGRQPNRVGATRTASGTSALLSEAGLRFETSMRAFQRFWMDIFQQVLALDAQYLPPGKEFRVTGRYPEILKINDRSELMGSFDLVLTATTETMNRQVMREDATVKLQAAMNPIALQFGLIGMKGLHRLLRTFYRVYGEADPDMIMEPMQDAVVRTPDQELSIWEEGGDSDPSPLENLERHFTEHQAQRQDPLVAQLLGPAGLAKLDAHISKTIQLIQMHAMSQQLAMGGKGTGSTATVGPQAQNAQIGASAPNQPTTRMMAAGGEGAAGGGY